MDLFNEPGFNVDDVVFVVLEDKKYYGKVKKIDCNLDRLKVDISSNKDKEVLQWFNSSFWKKV